MTEETPSSLRRFWAKLRGSVHPDDEAVFAAHPDHSFDLRFPPPAFVGDIDSAPIVVLMSNGGYKRGITEAEFPDDSSESEYRDYICGDRKKLPSRLSDYYIRHQIGAWIADGSAVMVNAVPYRSKKLSEEKNNQRVAKKLCSLAAHRRWLLEEVLPEAKNSRRFLLVHRNGWWKVPTVSAGPCVVFSRCPASASLAVADLDRASAWLRTH
jgi:hypothetical protein